MIKKTLSLGLIFCFLFTFIVSAEMPDIPLSASSALLMEAETGKIIFEKVPDQKLAPASITKIMTMLLIMEAIESGKIKYEDIVTASPRAKSMGGSTIYLDAGEQMSVRDLLKGIAVASANDACVAMGEYIAGTEEGFVSMMNNRAKELGMNNTNFMNTNGLDAPNHYSCARDIAIMSRELLKHKDILQFTTIWMDTLRNGQFGLANTNKLVRFYDGANGLKTGSTSGAGCCISATAERKGMTLISVIMNAPNTTERFNGARTLLDYGFANYAVFKGAKKGTSFGSVNVVKGKSEAVNAVADNDFSLLVNKENAQKVEQKVELIEKLNAPILKGTKVGTLKYMLGNEELGSVELKAETDVPKVTVFYLFNRFIRSMTFQR